MTPPDLAPSWLQHLRAHRTVPKLCGGDFEFANFFTGPAAPLISHPSPGGDAARALLTEVEGLSIPESPSPTPAHPVNPTTGPSPDDLSQDWGRKFLSNGGSYYIDLNHLEGCLPEVRSARDHVAAAHATYRIASAALHAANRRQPPGRRLHALANNSDGLGNSFGSHLNFLISRAAWEDLFHRKLHYQGFLASYQVSSILFTGLGKVGVESFSPPVPYQLSQRAEFFRVISGAQTTSQRPLLNSRDEAHTGRWPHHDSPHPATTHLARLHVIFYDHNLCHTAAFLKVGVLQILLAMIEAGAVDTSLLLDEPLRALHTWNRDPDLQSTAPLLHGGPISALDLQCRFAEAATRFVEAGRCSDVVPEAETILRLWLQTLDLLKARRFDLLSRHLDWVLKRSLLQQALDANPHLNDASPTLKHLDHLYSSLDPAEGLFWACERRGLVDRLVPDERIRHLQQYPPEDSRAWTRGHLLRLADHASLSRIDWDEIEFRIDGTPLRLYLELPDPLGFTRSDTPPRLAGDWTLFDALDSLGAILRVPAHDASRTPMTSG